MNLIYSVVSDYRLAQIVSVELIALFLSVSLASSPSAECTSREGVKAEILVEEFLEFHRIVTGNATQDEMSTSRERIESLVS
jgi:hypothetical protein